MLRSDREALKTGIHVIDKQHEEYADLVDSFFEMAVHGHVDRKALSDAVDKVLRYAMEHFDTEEQLMISLNYPHYEEHRVKHDIFRERTDGCVADVQSTEDMDVTAITLSKWLISWFCEQVQNDDLKLAKYIRSTQWMI